MNSPTDIPERWNDLDELKAALVDTWFTLPVADWRARAAECLRVDRTDGGSGWISDAVRSNYLANIMRGKILIGS
jgi:hypothetical protein